jgi:hypothetical protein
MAVSTLDTLLVDVIHEVGVGDIPDLVRVVNRKLKDLARKHNWRFYNTKGTITVLASYSTGTVNMTQDSTTVTGVGTSFTSAMVGRKFQVDASTGLYTITAVNSPTQLTLDAAWPYDDESGATYTIFQDVYALPSNLRHLYEVVDAVTEQPLIAVSQAEAQRYWSRYAYPSLDATTPPSPSWPWKYSAWVGANGVPSIRVNAISTKNRVLDVYYYRWPTEVSNITSAPDISEEMEEALHQSVFLHYVSRIPTSTQDQVIAKSEKMSIARAAFATALTEARTQDAMRVVPMFRNKRRVL